MSLSHEQREMANFLPRKAAWRLSLHQRGNDCNLSAVKSRQILAVVMTVLGPFGLIGVSQLLAGCSGKNQAPPPPPVAAQPTSTPPPTVDLAQLDPTPSASASASAAPTAVYHGGGVSPLAACCNSLAAAAKQSPPPNNMYLSAAATYCEGVAKSGNKDASLAYIRKMLQSAPLPPSCK